MKHFLMFGFLAVAACFVTACENEEDAAAIPIAPIILNVSFPSQSTIVPGKEVRIAGKGFSKFDQIDMSGESAQYTVSITEVTTEHVKFIVPADAGGEYSLTVTRDGKQTTLDGVLRVPLVVVLENLQLPAAPVQKQSEVNIAGRGFEEGDEITLSAPFYPEGEYKIVSSLTGDGIAFTLPAGLYGVNTMIITRGNRQTVLGNLTIETAVGDEVGGGIVYWVDAARAHGLIASKDNVGTATEPFGPEVAPSNASGTASALGSGQQNTQKIAAKMATLRAENDWPEWRDTKIAAELCDQFTVTQGSITYSDWFLPSREELIELFKVKSIFDDKGISIPKNNYWSSTEGDGDTAGWSAYYVNFYEDVNIVYGNVSKSGWKIGVRPVRAY